MGFLLGVLAGVAGSAAIGNYFRPIAKGAIKSSILLARKVQEIQSEVVEELSDLKAEADSELASETRHKPTRQRRPAEDVH